MNPAKERPQMFMRAVMAAVAALAVFWTVLHINWLSPGEAFMLSPPAAGGRAAERAPLALPKGEIAINSATPEELCALTGVGRVLAEAIIAEREAGGPFYFPEDLLSVKGIGAKKLAGFWGQMRLD